MVNSFDSGSRHLFRFLFAFVVVVAATNNVAADSTSEDGTDDLLSLFVCEEIEPFWTAAPYSASVMYENGDTKILEIAQANLTITEQNGCSATGINSWTDGKNEMGGEELVAISIIPPKSNNDKVEMIMMEIGEHPVNGTTAFIQAVVTANTDDDGTKTMHWIYEGRSNDEIAGSNYATIFDATFYEGSVPDSVEDEMGNNTANNDCVDISGMWTADPFTYFKIYQDCDQTIDIMGPTSLVWNLTQNGCQVHGVNNWNNGKYSGLDYMVGAVTGVNVILTEVKHDDHADGHFRAIVSDDGKSMSNSFIGLTNDYTMAFDTMMARGDTVPNADQRSCDVDLVGTWTSIQDVVTLETMDADGITSSTTFPEVNLIIEGQRENGCEFWGSSEILSFNFGGVVMPNDTPDGTTKFALATQRKDDTSRGISNAHLIKSNDDDSDDDDGNNHLISFTELSRSQDATSGTYFTTIFQKQSMNVTASDDTPPPPVVVVAGNTTNVKNETGSDELVLDDTDTVPPPTTTTTDDAGNVPPTTTTTTDDSSSSDASASATPSLSQVYTTTTIVVINLLVAVSAVVVSVIY